MMPTPSIRTRAAGVSLLEVLIMAVILGVCALALGQAMMGAMHQTRMADEMRAASFSARRALEMVLAKPDINAINTDHGAPAAGILWDLNSTTLIRGQVFNVSLSDSPTLTLSGPNDAPAGEVIVLNDENMVLSNVGRNLDGVGGPDGVSMAPWPMDLNGDGIIPSAGTNKRIVVGVVIRWLSVGGTEQRYELWSVR